MSARGRSEIKGMKACREALAELGKATERNVGKRALRVPAEIIADAVRARAPVSNRAGNQTPGSLRASIEVKPQRSVKGRARISIVADDVAAVPNEYGTAKMLAQPFFRPAVDGVRERAGRAFAAALKGEVDAAVERVAAKAAKAQ